MQIEYCRVGGGRMRRRAVRVPVDISSRLGTSGVAYCLACINITVYGKLILTWHTSYYWKDYSLLKVDNNVMFFLDVDKLFTLNDNFTIPICFQIK